MLDMIWFDIAPVTRIYESYIESLGQLVMVICFRVYLEGMYKMSGVTVKSVRKGAPQLNCSLNHAV